MKREIWDNEKLKNIAILYNTRNDFRLNEPNAYCSAKRRAILNDICSHMVSGKIKWTKEKIIDVAKKYTSISDFRKLELAVYKRASANRWLDEVCSHMEKSEITYTKENKIKRLIYVYEFPDKHVYVGLTCNETKRHKQHQINGPVYKHVKKTNLTPLKKIISNGYIDVNDAINLEIKTIKDYKTDGWILLNKLIGGQLGGGFKMTKKENENLKKICQDEANKYEYRNEFKKNSPLIYEKVRRHMWLDIICSHMKYKYKKKREE